jgi:hypothetical protein|tara:strand:- start:520 stop:681 length:162 start_codon:yes stop_codon:yes gene_type:complete
MRSVRDNDRKGYFENITKLGLNIVANRKSLFIRNELIVTYPERLITDRTYAVE